MVLVLGRFYKKIGVHQTFLYALWQEVSRSLCSGVQRFIQTWQLLDWMGLAADWVKNNRYIGLQTFIRFFENVVSCPIPHTVLSVRGAPQNWFSSLWYGTRLPLGQRGARLGIDCTADLLLVLKWDETASGTVRSKTENRQLSSAMLLLAVPEAVSSHTKLRSRYQLCSSFSVLLLAVPEAVSSHTKRRRISSTRS